MARRRVRVRSPLLLAGLGVTLTLAAVGHHAGEILDLNGLLGPLTALVLDGSLGLAIVYGGVRLSAADLPTGELRRVVGTSLAGGVLLLSVIGATYLVRALEGRPVAEPQFPLLIAAEVGLLAGMVVGYYQARVRAEARQLREVSDALTFVNHLIRHDLLNDLNVIKGRAGILLEDGLPSETESNLAVIDRRAESAIDRIDTSRAVTEVLVGEADLASVELTALVEDAAAEVATTYDVTVETDLPETAAVRANEGLRSVVDNLLENAAEHNDAAEPHVEVDVAIEGERVVLSVVDNGPGIPDDARAVLEGDTTGERGGDGVSLVARLVDAYDGTVSVDDAEPRGSRVSVSLPRAGAEPSTGSGETAE